MATSKLQIEVGDLLDKNFPQYRIRENFRPDWFISSNQTRLEMDFYIEELKIAFEIQGSQHFEFTPFFHKDYSNFEKRLMFDEEKKQLCQGYKIKFYEICTLTDAIVAIKEIKDSLYVPTGNFYYQKKIQKIEPSKKILRKLTPEAARIRYERALDNLERYNKGEIEATQEKIDGWKKAIETNGFVIDLVYG